MILKLVLGDGAVFSGYSFEYSLPTSGKVGCNTGIVWYPESLAYPSYSGQILVFNERYRILIETRSVKIEKLFCPPAAGRDFDIRISCFNYYSQFFEPFMFLWLSSFLDTASPRFVT